MSRLGEFHLSICLSWLVLNTVVTETLRRDCQWIRAWGPLEKEAKWEGLSLGCQKSRRRLFCLNLMISVVAGFCDLYGHGYLLLEGGMDTA